MSAYIANCIVDAIFDAMERAHEAHMKRLREISAKIDYRPSREEIVAMLGSILNNNPPHISEQSADGQEQHSDKL